MKILHVSYAYPPFFHFGGPPAAVRSLAENLARRGHDISVVTSNNGLRTRTVKDGDVQATYLARVARYRSSFTVNPGIFPYVSRNLKSFDVVHIYGINDSLGWIVGSYCRKWDIPYVVEPLGMYRPSNRSLRKKKVYRQFAAQPLLRAAKAVIATSYIERDELLDEGIPREKILVRRNGIDVSEFQQLPPSGSFRRRLGMDETELLTLFLGRLNPIKRVDLLIRAFAEMAPPRGKLAVVGPDEEGQRRLLARLVRSLHVSHDVVFVGPLYGGERLSALVDADLFVLPSERESFGTSAAEAIAAGTPVIVTERCGIAPYLANGGGLVVGMDLRSMTSALASVLHDSAFRASLTRRAEDLAGEFSWDSPVIEMENLYTRLLMRG